MKKFSSCLLALLLTAGCPGPDKKKPLNPEPKLTASEEAPEVNLLSSWGASSAQSGPSATPTLGPALPAGGKTLGRDEVNALLSRMKSLPAIKTDETDFSLREKSAPAPRTGTELKVAFPPVDLKSASKPEAAGPLAVLRRAPEGELALVPEISVSFSQPMLAVSSVEEIAKLSVPVKITPQIKGQWRWLGTKTVIFTPDGEKDKGFGRLPMATEYAVEIPAGTKSALGNSLEKTERFTFSTPPPKLLKSYPNSGAVTALTPNYFLAFDQKINPDEVLRLVTVTAGKARQELRLLTEEEARKDSTLDYLIKNTEPGRWLAFAMKQELPKDAEVSVEIAAGLPSAEGPRKTTLKQSYSFKTYGPMRVTDLICDYSEETDCSPGTPIELLFSNPLAEDSFDKKTMLKVSPALDKMLVSAGWGSIEINGKTKPNTSYRVTVSGKIKDIYGQALGKDFSGAVKYGIGPEFITAPKSGLVVLDPGGNQKFSVFSTNHKSLQYKLFSVTPEDWDDFAEYENARFDEKKPKFPGKLVASKTVSIAYRADELIETQLDLSPALKDGLGHAFLFIEPTKKNKYYPEDDQIYAWIQATQIGLDVSSDATELYGLATSLSEGKPLEGVEVLMYPGGATTRSAKDGSFKLALTKDAPKLLIAKTGKDQALMGGNDWSAREAGETPLRWMVFDDRKMYRPGETVTLKGWIRAIDTGEKGDLQKLPAWAKKLTYTVTDSRAVKLKEGEATINAYGGFDLAVKLPATPNLGGARVKLSLLGAPEKKFSSLEHGHSFQIQEFRRPEFEVTTSVEPGPFFIDSKVKASTRAKYYTGGVLADAEASWSTTTSPTNYTPPNQGEFSFGYVTSRWSYYDRAGLKSTSKTFSGKTDGQGTHEITLDFTEASEPRALRVSASATVTDVNRQAFSDSASFVVHPASLYVGLKSEKFFVNKGEPFNVETIVSDLEGNLKRGISYKVKAVRYDWAELEDGTVAWKDVDPQECAVTSGTAPQACTFQTPEGGSYSISAEITDDKGRKNRTQIPLLASGGKQPPSRELKKGEVTLIPDQSEYKPGDTAKILVQPPFTPAEGVFTLRRNGIVTSERFSVPENGSYTAKVLIEDWQIPNVFAQVELVGAQVRTNDKGEPQPKLPKQPAFASGRVSLSVPPRNRTLAVKVAPKEPALEPGASTQLQISVTDDTGKPVPNSEVVVVVVDESVLALSNYQTPNPLSIFYTERSAGGRDSHLRDDVVLSGAQDVTILPPPPASVGGLTASGGRGNIAPSPKKMSVKDPAMRRSEEAAPGGGSAPSIQVRSDFNALALFAASVVTDSKGAAVVPFTLPDNLTRYRIMAIAVEGERRFGSSEATITARLPLMVRPSPPRFLHFGDKFELPVVLQNQTDAPLVANVAVRATNTSLKEGMGYQVVVPANNRLEVRFPMSTNLAGTARFQVGASAGKWSDAAEFSLPVYAPATTEASATYGTIDKGAIVQPIKAPDDVFSSYGGVEITTSSTAVAELTDAVLYLQAYPYECAEQLASRVISVVALKDVLAAFNAEGLPSPEEMIAAMKRDLTKLKSMQNNDGGFGFWRKGDTSWPYLSIHVAHALARAKEKGFEVPQEMVDRSLYYLQNIEAKYPAYYGPEIKATLSAYALYARMRLGEVEVKKAKKLIKDNGLDTLSLEAVGWLLPVLDRDIASTADERAAIRKLLASRASETAGAANFTSSYSDGAYLLLHSNRRVDGILLEAMITDDEKNELIPKLVRGLLNQRKAGRWGNTQENAFILLALSKYFETYENITPDFVARAWLGETYAGSSDFKGRSTNRYQMNVPMSVLQKGTPSKDLILSKEGEGRLYYRIGMSYAPTNLKSDPVDYGFTVTRKYEGVDHPDDVTKDANGIWHIKAGSRVRVKLEMVAQSRRYHVALVDPLAAGLEAQNPALATTGPIPQESTSSGSGRYWWWYRTWYEHQNLRDERVEAFASLLWDGVYQYSYVARATTPGVFVVPPAKAEEMYAPETFGRSASDLLIIE